MQLGDLVRERPEVMRMLAGVKSGIIVDIDPLRRGCSAALAGDDNTGEPQVEIVVLLPDGALWHAAPRHWEVISESR